MSLRPTGSPLHSKNREMANIKCLSGKTENFDILENREFCQNTENFVILKIKNIAIFAVKFHICFLRTESVCQVSFAYKTFLKSPK